MGFRKTDYVSYLFSTLGTIDLSVNESTCTVFSLAHTVTVYVNIYNDLPRGKIKRIALTIQQHILKS